MIIIMRIFDNYQDYCYLTMIVLRITDVHDNDEYNGLSIYYVIRDKGGGVSPIITIQHRGVLQSLLQYYRFGRNMEGDKSFSVLHMILCCAKSTHFVSNLEKCREYSFSILVCITS